TAGRGCTARFVCQTRLEASRRRVRIASRDRPPQTDAETATAAPLPDGSVRADSPATDAPTLALMKILAAWDDLDEAELLRLYLTVDDNEAVFVASPEELLVKARSAHWDAVLLSVTYPATVDEGFALFRQMQQLQPGVPVVVGCRPHEMIELPKFLKQGLRFY